MNLGVRIAGREGGHVAQDQVLGEIAPVGGNVLLAHNGEGIEHIGGGVPVEAVEHEVNRIQARPRMAAFVLIPGEGLALVSHIARERLHVVSGVGQF